MSGLFLFYSYNCPHSKNLLSKINGTSICNYITFINIDNSQIPSFIQVVPTLYMKNNNKILIEDNLNQWFDNVLNGVSIESITGNNNIAPFMSHEMLGGHDKFGYSFIDDSINEQVSHNYGFIDSRDTSKMPLLTKYNDTPNITEKKNSQHDLNSQLEILKQQRQKDIPMPLARN